MLNLEQKRKVKAFTLIELLVVIAIIAIRSHPLPRVRKSTRKCAARVLPEQSQTNRSRHLYVQSGL